MGGCLGRCRRGLGRRWRCDGAARCGRRGAGRRWCWGSGCRLRCGRSSARGARAAGSGYRGCGCRDRMRRRRSRCRRQWMRCWRSYRRRYDRTPGRRRRDYRRCRSGRQIRCGFRCRRRCRDGRCKRWSRWPRCKRRCACRRCRRRWCNRRGLCHSRRNDSGNWCCLRMGGRWRSRWCRCGCGRRSRLRRCGCRRLSRWCCCRCRWRSRRCRCCRWCSGCCCCRWDGCRRCRGRRHDGRCASRTRGQRRCNGWRWRGCGFWRRWCSGGCGCRRCCCRWNRNVRNDRRFGRWWCCDGRCWRCRRGSRCDGRCRRWHRGSRCDGRCRRRRRRRCSGCSARRCRGGGWHAGGFRRDWRRHALCCRRRLIGRRIDALRLGRSGRRLRCKSPGGRPRRCLRDGGIAVCSSRAAARCAAARLRRGEGFARIGDRRSLRRFTRRGFAGGLACGSAWTRGRLRRGGTIGVGVWRGFAGAAARFGKAGVGFGVVAGSVGLLAHAASVARLAADAADSAQGFGPTLASRSWASVVCQMALRSSDKKSTCLLSSPPLQGEGLTAGNPPFC